MDKLSRTDECVTIERYKFRLLLFADHVVLLAYSESDLQHALTDFAAACDKLWHCWNDNQHFQN